MDGASWRDVRRQPLPTQAHQVIPNKSDGPPQQRGGHRGVRRDPRTPNPDDASLFPWFRQIPRNGKGPALG